ncbi:MAG: DHH family phosphoesterase, partial [Promethearchaeota archaeon]
RTSNASLGIAIAMGARKEIYKQSKRVRQNYSKLIQDSLIWVEKEKKIQQKEYIQYFFGEDVIPENIIGTITSILIFENIQGIDTSKPIFGLAKRKDEDIYKVSGRAHEKIVKQGVNLSEAIREACILLNLDVLGGGHPPAAGVKIPIDMVENFLESCNLVIQNQLRYIRS